jgi:hypothetical protein
MARIVCTLPNASELINGIKFIESKGQMISEEVEDAVVEFFTAIPGYFAHKPRGKAAAGGADPQDPAPPASAPVDGTATSPDAPASDA